MSEVPGFQGLIPVPITYGLGAVRVPGKLPSFSLNGAELRESQAPAGASRHCPGIKGLEVRGRAEASPAWGRSALVWEPLPRSDPALRSA